MRLDPATTIYSIVGTTSSGKTDFALQLAKKALVDKVSDEVWIISADSKQVYRSLEVLTGADIPEGYECRDKSRLVPTHFLNTNDGIKLFGIGCVEPGEEWSVGHFRQLVHSLLEKKTDRTLVLIVGGTGLYHDSLFKTDAELSIPPNVELRKKMANLSVEKLQSWLRESNPEKFKAMNNSDRNNPRRLMRAIEVGISDVDTALELSLHRFDFDRFDHKYIGLQANLDNLEEKIEKRIIQRLRDGAIEEVEHVLGRNDFGVETHCNAPVHQVISPQIHSIIGFQEILDLIKGVISEKECIEKWKIRETQYAKRQITWWKQRKNVEWE